MSTCNFDTNKQVKEQLSQKLGNNKGMSELEPKDNNSSIINIKKIDLTPVILTEDQKDEEIARLEKYQSEILEDLAKNEREFILNRDDYEMLCNQLTSDVHELENETFDLEFKIQQDKQNYIELECEEQEIINDLQQKIANLNIMLDQREEDVIEREYDLNQKLQSQELQISQLHTEIRSLKDLLESS